MKEPQIIYEDQDLLVIDKPSGMVVNRAQSVKGETVQDWLERRSITGTTSTTGITGTDFEKRSGIVHRLDKETSGVLLIAKTEEAFMELQRQFKAREVEKTYVALVHGRVEPEEGVIQEPVGRLPWNRKRFGVLAGGREAETGYKVLQHLEVGSGRWETGHRGGRWDRSYHPPSHLSLPTSFSLLELYPRTGRTHQIRVHLKSINHPIVGDPLYAGRKTGRADRQWCPRLFLHAEKIVFKHPVNGKMISVEAPMPKDLEEIIRQLKTEN